MGTDISRFGARNKARELAAEVEVLRAELERTGALGLLEIQRQRETLEAENAVRRETLASEEAELRSSIAKLQEEVVVTEETALLQEAGIYEYHHPLENSLAYQDQLTLLRARIKEMAKVNGGAVLGSTNWTVNNSLAQGRKMVRDFSKLMLRAYNAEADNLVRGLKAYKLDSAISRLTKIAQTIGRLGQTMGIHIAQEYHDLRIQELELTADYREKQAEEKEREREEKARLREERRAQKEMEAERARLEKERQHHLNALAALETQGDEEAVARLREQLGDVEKAIEDVDYRVANIRAGYVYVISNVGSFGDRIVKIGMTRRIDPHDRVRELSDASVPFNFDTHALFFSQDARGVEAELHSRLGYCRVNRVNMRREFFATTPDDVKKHLLEVAGELLEFQDIPEALEFHQSQNLAKVQVDQSGIDAAEPDPLAID